MFAPKNEKELTRAIAECVQWDDYCRDGPKGPITSWDVSSMTNMKQMFASHFVFSEWVIYILCTVQNYAIANYARCIIIQGATFSNVQDYAKYKSWQVQNYAKCKTKESAELCNVNNHAKRKFMQIVKSYKVQKYARCQIIQGGTFMQCETCMQGADSTLLKGAAAFKWIFSICLTCASSSFWSLFKSVMILIFGGIKGRPPLKINVFFRATCTSFSAVIKEYIKCIF